MIFVTGGAGFIGANFVVDWLTPGRAALDEPVLVIDSLTYAGNLANLAAVRGHCGLLFERRDICDGSAVLALLRRHRPRAVVHFAAESHVDRSILGPAEFVRTNIEGTFALLEAARAFVAELCGAERDAFRFLHVSTDEVYGSLSADDPPFSETTAYAPNSPYAASKAASDHLVRAYHHTYALPTLTTNCSNNYGPFQFPEKLIPLVVLHALEGKALPVYGDGQNVRDWLYVGDHCAAIRTVLERGRLGQTYNIGGRQELPNIAVVRAICVLLDELRPRRGGSYAQQITFVKDRPGHDRRYAIDCGKIERELGWLPTESFDSGLRKTIDWYLASADWIAQVRSGKYRDWIELQYGAHVASTAEGTAQVLARGEKGGSEQ
ncbi:dTDP-glucose 4,6 dehydratase, NAD(P)-binding [Burkholderiales bacterium]|nr:dTDP-glucose 4,6 dehydratase, NAD(P)-binding [Burkholderiales bacterium]